VNDVLTEHHKVFLYKPHTWGPKQADDLITDPDRWHNPEMT
jgi:glucose-6-phosphate 1-dehydrogenase